MAGESILVIDDSLAVQEIAQSALAGAGYRVSTAANGAAALTYPGIEEVRLFVIDGDMAGLSGEQTTRMLKARDDTHATPVLLLMDEEQVPERESINVGGVCGYLLKPFSAEDLTRKVEQVLLQQSLDEMALKVLAQSADRMMQTLADQQIQAAVQRKTELIVERCIHNVMTTVDQRARVEVDDQIKTLIDDKEQELVKLTVREVAQSMVEKLATAKVKEAIETVLREETERAVRRLTDQLVPSQIREKIKEMLGNILPREVESKLHRAAEKVVDDIGEALTEIVRVNADKTVPRLGRELLPPVIESQVATALNQTLPRRVQELVGRELAAQTSRYVDPELREATKRLRREIMRFNVLFAMLLTTGVGALAYYLIFLTG